MCEKELKTPRAKMTDYQQALRMEGYVTLKMQHEKRYPPLTRPGQPEAGLDATLPADMIDQADRAAAEGEGEVLFQLSPEQSVLESQALKDQVATLQAELERTKAEKVQVEMKEEAVRMQVEIQLKAAEHRIAAEIRSGADWESDQSKHLITSVACSLDMDKFYYNSVTEQVQDKAGNDFMAGIVQHCAADLDPAERELEAGRLKELIVTRLTVLQPSLQRALSQSLNSRRKSMSRKRDLETESEGLSPPQARQRRSSSGESLSAPAPAPLPLRSRSCSFHLVN
jgi:hypothetical protein